MKQVIINVPDNKYNFFIKMLRSIDFINKYNEENIVVSDKEKNLIRERIKNANPGSFKNWEDIKDSFNFD